MEEEEVKNKRVYLKDVNGKYISCAISPLTKEDIKIFKNLTGEGSKIKLAIPKTKKQFNEFASILGELVNKDLFKNKSLIIDKKDWINGLLEIYYIY